MDTLNDNVKVKVGHKTKELVVITGPNGVGKSMFLLKYHELWKKDNKSDENMYGKIVYMSSNQIFDQSALSYARFNVFRSYKEGDKEVENIVEAIKLKIQNKDLTDLELSVTKCIRKKFKDSGCCTRDLYSIIIEMLNNTVKETSKPTDYLNTICYGYLEKFDHYRKQAQNSAYFLKLFEFYKKMMETGNLSADDFIKKWGTDKDFANEVIFKYAVYNCRVEEFLEELNSMLKIIGFKYKFIVENQDFIIKFMLINMDDKISIGFDKIKFSSGESWILGVLMWQYKINTPSFSDHGKLTKFDVILLDEPDRHLDPALCKQFLDIITKVFQRNGIQVIMTTHRVDTVAIAPEGSIFKLPANYSYATNYESSEDQLNSLQNSHKLESIFRMTANLREITNYHHKVYTEALDDAYFYECVYSFLRGYCSETRKDARDKLKVGDERLFWDISGKKIRILSERCQLSFYPVSTSGNDQGGCEEVKKAVRRGQNFHDATKGPFNALELLNPYGILDNDYGKNYELSADRKVNIEDYIVTFERHSLENLLYDPFIIVSILKYENSCSKFKASIEKCYQDLNEALNENPINLEKVQNAVNKCFYQLIKKEKFDKKQIEKRIWKEYKRSYVSRKSNKEKYHDTQLKTLIDQIFKIDIEIDNFQLPRNSLDKLFDSTADSNILKLKDIIKPEQIINLRIEERFKVNSLNKLGTKKIFVILNKDQSIEIEYPNIFLQWRGHELNSPASNGEKKKIKKNLLNNLHLMYKDYLKKEEKSSNLFIPLDIAELFFNLSTNVRNNVRKIIKPDGYKITRELTEKQPEFMSTVLRCNNTTENDIEENLSDTAYFDKNRLHEYLINALHTDTETDTDTEEHYIPKFFFNFD